MTWGTNDYSVAPGPIPGEDKYGYALDQCASFMNWRCMNDLGMPAIHNPNGNDGGQFADTLHDLYGVPMDGSPRVHDVMSIPPFTHDTGQYGHTCGVLAVNNDGTVYVEDYNWYDTGEYLRHTINYSGCKFAHVLAPPAPIEGTDMSNVRFVYWKEKNQQHAFQLNVAGELFAKYWPGANNNWGNAKIGSNLDPTQGLDVQFSDGGQLHVVCVGKDGYVHQFYQSASGAGSTTWTEQRLP